MENKVKQDDKKNEYICEELVLGLMAPIGTDLHTLTEELSQQLKTMFNYHVEIIKLSDFIVTSFPDEFENIKKLNCSFCEKREKILYGTKLRKSCNDNAILAKLAVNEIFKRREMVTKASPQLGFSKIDPLKNFPFKKSTIRIAYVIDQIKRKEEIDLLNEIYKKSFFMVGCQSSVNERRCLLTKQINKPESFAQELMDLDQNEEEYFRSMVPCNSCKRSVLGHITIDGNKKDYGQQLSKIFPESDVFVSDKNCKKPIRRFLDLIFSSPLEFPTSNEHAMFMAFAASTKSADLSRQVGAVILSKSGDLVSSGSNDVPKYGGGVYDYENHRNDGAFGVEANSKRLSEISQNISNYLIHEGIVKAEKLEDLGEKILKNTEIANLTEFHRAVHAEMQAILNATRNGTTTKQAKIFVTTFPCHNCAKHIVSSGIDSVYYIEPYLKSQAKNLHNDSIVIVEDESEVNNRVTIKPFYGVGPRRFMDLFSMKLSCGDSLIRKDGFTALDFNPAKARMRFWYSIAFPFPEMHIIENMKFELLLKIEEIEKMAQSQPESEITITKSVFLNKILDVIKSVS